MKSYARGAILIALLLVLLTTATPAGASIVLWRGTPAEYALSGYANQMPPPECAAPAPPPVEEQPVLVAFYPLLYNSAVFGPDLSWQPSTCYAYAYVGLQWVAVACW
jgi:hypothetical protein